MPAATVIVTVYNHWEWLRLILQALEHQTRQDFEIVIADDGSDAATVKAIDSYIAAHPGRRIQHVWHEDKGWRKNIILNKAVKAAASDYLIFVDGDCVPHPKFVADHCALRCPDTVNAGRRVDLTRSLTERFEATEQLPVNYFSLIRNSMVRNILAHGLAKGWRPLRRSLRFPMPGGKPLGAMPDTGILGCNFSIEKKLLEEVNGFDERYLAPGTGEDTDLGQRLLNAGKTIRRISRYALQFHRLHQRLDFSDPNNAALIEAVRRDGTTRTPYGLTHEAPE